MLAPAPPVSVPPTSKSAVAPSEDIPIIDIRSIAASPTVVGLEDGIRTQVIAGLSRRYNERELPSLLLYDEEGLRLFEEITYQPDYYLTDLEISILSKYASQIADAISDGAIVLELGAGALRKTALILDAIEAQKKSVTYLALDLDRAELVRTLGQLRGRYNCVSLAGLWGTYDDGRAWLTGTKDHARFILWLGSSIGNMTRHDAGQFIRSFADVLTPQDRFVVAIDSKLHDTDVIRRAYGSIAQRFALNALVNLNKLFAADVVDVSHFEYRPYYNEIKGRNEAYFRCMTETQLRIPDQTPITIYEGEFIRFAFSHKYDEIERQLLWTSANAQAVKEWSSDGQGYTLTMLSWFQ
ncbi:histidine-specific methyltransferase [Phlebopus sp. FC_14]|nr:histidine-specific methyltransferase [Phlebopus sp. FC_14]